MRIEVSVEKLRTKKLFIATPMYGGVCSGMYSKSMIDLGILCAKYGVDMKFFALFNESLITRARNYLSDEFIRSEYDHLMFIDSDVAFNPHDVLSLHALLIEKPDEYDIIGGAYPKKVISWEKVVKAVKLGKADENPNELEKYVGDFVFNPVAGESKISLNAPVEISELGTGFMMIKKDVFSRFEASYPELRYTPDHNRTEHFNGSRQIHAFFETVIDPESNRYLSEDYFFCQYSRRLGIHVHLCPWMQLSHVGSYVFNGSLPHLASIGTSHGMNSETEDPNARLVEVPVKSKVNRKTRRVQGKKK